MFDEKESETGLFDREAATEDGRSSRYWESHSRRRSIRNGRRWQASLYARRLMQLRVLGFAQDGGSRGLGHGMVWVLVCTLV